MGMVAVCTVQIEWVLGPNCSARILRFRPEFSDFLWQDVADVTDLAAAHVLLEHSEDGGGAAERVEISGSRILGLDAVEELLFVQFFWLIGRAPALVVDATQMGG